MRKLKKDVWEDMKSLIDDPYVKDKPGVLWSVIRSWLESVDEYPSWFEDEQKDPGPSSGSDPGSDPGSGKRP